MRYYVGTHTNEITDLYDGAYYIDRYRKNVKAENFAGAGTNAFINKKLSVGDVVQRDYDGFVAQSGVFGQAEYDFNNLTAFVAGSLNNTTQWRKDRFLLRCCARRKRQSEQNRLHRQGRCQL